jgi:exo-1,4-beta-D-glucosaminidase
MWMLFSFILVPLVCVAQTGSHNATGVRKLLLAQNWTLESSCKIQAGGEQISAPGFKVKGWHRTSVPSTVLAALVADGTYRDPYFGMNLRSIPGATYPIATNFAHQSMPDDSPFKCSWWYRTEFSLPPQLANKNVWLHLAGINYRANIWLNGSKIADSADVAGAYRDFEFRLNKTLRPRGKNALAIETFAPEPQNLAINWVDWNPMPPDKDMGLWKDVSLMASGPVALRHPFVSSKVDGSHAKASITISVVAQNADDHPVRGVLKASFGTVRVQQAVDLAAGETKAVSFSPELFPVLNVDHPALWWPYQMGRPNLQRLELRFEIKGQISDVLSTRFGIREITSELDEHNNRLFKINGKRLLVRGGGWAPDMLLRQSKERLEQEFAYVKHLHLNTLRLEGKMETEDFFNLADQEGILVMAGWCCCDIWEEWAKWQLEQHHVAVESLRSQALRLRSHPSVLVWLYGSDNPPPPDVEREYLAVLQETNWPNPALSSASHTPTAVTGVSGVKMTGPYQYVPPSYWLNLQATSLKFGGAFGFNTETSPGPAIPVVESLTKMVGKEHLWPIDDVWNYHAGSQEFKNLDIFNNAMNAMYGKPAELEDYQRKAQAMAYDGERAMFEAYRGNKYTSTGVIQWMLNNAWPSTIWHLYDYYLQPAGGFYGARKANEPVHIQLSYDDRSVVVVNGGGALSRLKASAELYDFDLRKQFARQVTVDAPEDISQKLFAIPESSNGTGLTFLKLQLEDRNGKVLSSNFYWLPPTYSTFNWPATTFEYTPSPSYEDVTQLNKLPRVKLAAKVLLASGKAAATVRLTNPGKTLAFMVTLRAVNKTDGKEVLPVFWDDNYFALLPGESRTVAVHYLPGQLSSVRRMAIEVGGWNVEPQSISLALPAKK